MAGELRIAAWPAEERPRERLYHKGAAALSDAELLAIQLGTGIRGMSALDLARGLLTQFGTLQELAGREVAEVVRFLAGDGAAYITGQTIHVNGGL